MYWFDQVKEFHEKYDLPVSLDDTTLLDTGDITLRIDLIAEEFDEVTDALADLSYTLNLSKRTTNEVTPEEVLDNHIHVLKELCDLVYVTVGTAVALGYDFDKGFEAVHKSNMTKDGGKSDEGKLTKGASYVEPVGLDECV